MENFVKRLQLVRKKLLPLLLCVAVAGSQVPVMAADVEGFSDSAEGFNEEWSEDTQTQSAEAEDTTETAEGNTAGNTGIPDEQTEDIAEAAERGYRGCSFAELRGGYRDSRNIRRIVF